MGSEKYERGGSWEIGAVPSHPESRRGLPRETRPASSLAFLRKLYSGYDWSPIRGIRSLIRTRESGPSIGISL